MGLNVFVHSVTVSVYIECLCILLTVYNRHEMVPCCSVSDI